MPKSVHVIRGELCHLDRSWRRPYYHPREYTRGIRKIPQGFTIKTLNDGSIVYFEYNIKNMGKSAEQYIRSNTSSKNVDLKELSKIDQKGIHVGIALVGMSKKGG